MGSAVDHSDPVYRISSHNPAGSFTNKTSRESPKVYVAREEAHLSQAALAEQIGCDERTILNIENDRGNPKFEVLCQIIAYLHIPADQIFHPDTATDGLKKQKLLLMLQECDEQEAAEILPAIEYLLALIHKRGNSNE